MQAEQAYQTDEDQVNPHDIFEQAGDHEDQDSGDQGQQRGEGDMDVHAVAFEWFRWEWASARAPT
jgi:hypothetical protein